MATRSHIVVKNPDQSISYIYCHWDGYPSHNGAILKEHYTTMDKVNELMRLGDLSVLAPEIGEKQDFDDFANRNRNWCLAYGRDRGDKNTLAKTGEMGDLLKDDFVDYVYIFDGEFWDCWDVHLKTSVNLYDSVPAGT